VPATTVEATTMEATAVEATAVEATTMKAAMEGFMPETVVVMEMVETILEEDRASNEER
jgi:hypothetical protein